MLLADLTGAKETTEVRFPCERPGEKVKNFTARNLVKYILYSGLISFSASTSKSCYTPG
jgi:hypothetical protein